MRILIPSRPVALLDEIFPRSCSTIFLVIGGITNRGGNVLIDLLSENSLSRVSNSVESILSENIIVRHILGQQETATFGFGSQIRSFM